jgi:folate-binding protein YgfZ
MTPTLLSPTRLTLPSRALVRFGGAEAVDFLNDLITADAATIPEGQLRPAMLLTPQGRVLFDFLISRDGDDLVIELDRERRAEFIKKMTLYRMRRAVTITPDDRAVEVKINGDEGLIDPRFDGSVRRLYEDFDQSAIDPQDETLWQAYRYRQGVAEGANDLPPEKALPLEARLDLNDGISFQKGCYIGQEVTARTRYRGLIKRSYLPVRLDQPIETPCDVMAEGRLAGEVLGLVQDEDGWLGLASIRLDALAAETALTADGQAITALFPERLMPLPAPKDK